VGVNRAVATCAGRYLDPILHLSPAPVVVVVGAAAHAQLAEPSAEPGARNPNTITKAGRGLGCGKPGGAPTGQLCGSREDEGLGWPGRAG